MSAETFFLIAMGWLLFWIAACLVFVRLVTWLEPDEEPRPTPERRGTGR